MTGPRTLPPATSRSCSRTAPAAGSGWGRRSRSLPTSSARRGPPVCRPRASGSASTPRTCGAPATRSIRRRAWTRCSPRSTSRSGSTGWSWSTSTTRAPSAARAPTATSTSARAGSAVMGSAGCSPTRSWRTSPTSSRRRAWTRATTRSTWPAPAFARRRCAARRAAGGGVPAAQLAGPQRPARPGRDPGFRRPPIPPAPT